VHTTLAWPATTSERLNFAMVRAFGGSHFAIPVRLGDPY
jgi:hypothetical protein